MTTRRGRTAAVRGAVLGAAALTGLVGCTGTEGVAGGPSAPTEELGEVRLVSHDSCDGLLDWFHDEAGSRVGPYGLVGSESPTFFTTADDAVAGSRADSASSAPAAESAAGDAGSGTSSSTTNTQEPGIGEPDLVWTDGTRLATVVNGQLQVVDLEAAVVTAELDLRPDDDTSTTPTGLLVDGEHALVIQTVDPMWAYDMPVAAERGGVPVLPRPIEPATVLTRVDLEGEPTVLGSVTIDGAYVDARMVDGVVRAVVRSSSGDLGFVQPAGSSASALARAISINQEVVAESTLDDWLPSMTITVDGREPSSGPAVDCAAVDHPTSFGGFDVVTVVGLDLRSGAVDPLPSAAVVADAETVYASPSALYVATTRYPGGHPTYAPDGTPPTTIDPEDRTLRTEIHAFSLPDDVAARYQASGAVPGALVDQFALSEQDGDLRAASTEVPGAWGFPMPIEDGPASSPATADVVGPTVTESRITVLRPDGAELRVVGEVTGLGPTEQIRGVRFAGPRAYVVTFRQTDPLFVVDLADPAAPRVAGELKIPGYSSYLQVLDEGRVLGLGQDATDRGRTTGLQESLFDVSDPSTPTRLAQLVVPDAMSTAETDHHALLWWPDARLLAVPFEQWGRAGSNPSPRAGVLVTRVTDDAITEVGTVTHPGSSSGGYGGAPACPPGTGCIEPALPVLPIGYPTPIARSLVAGGRLVTVSTAGVKVSDLTTLEDVSWVALG